jgi:ubiquinone/menaquinone biosynthesis C-methylase UbiE
MSIRKVTVDIKVDQVSKPFFDKINFFFDQANLAKQHGDMAQFFMQMNSAFKNLEAISHNVPHHVYTNKYSPETLKERPFYNIGGGENWYHPYWQVIDAALLHDHAGIKHLFDGETALPVGDERAKIVYSSHCLEHLPMRTVEHLLAEIYRIMEPDGLLRLALPDMDFFSRAYGRGDNDYMINVVDNSGQYKPLSLEQNWLSQFAYPCSVLCKETPELHIGDEEVKKLINDLGYEGAMDEIVGRIPDDLSLDIFPHINWFNEKKLKGLLEKAGFVDIEKSAYGQSSETVLCDVMTFDYTTPETSLYMEARKRN